MINSWHEQFAVGTQYKTKDSSEIGKIGSATTVGTCAAVKWVSMMSEVLKNKFNDLYPNNAEHSPYSVEGAKHHTAVQKALNVIPRQSRRSFSSHKV